MNTNFTQKSKKIIGTLAIIASCLTLNAQTPFPCTSAMYEVAGSSVSSTLSTINVNTGVTTAIASYSVSSNSLAYNSFDNLLWCIQNGNQLVRIDATGTVYPVTVPNLTFTSGPNNGEISSSGYYYVPERSTLAGGYYCVDVNPSSPYYLQIVSPFTFLPILSAPYTTTVTNPSGVTGVALADWAFNPADGMLWSVSHQAAGLTPASEVRIFTMNPATGAIALQSPPITPALGNLGSFGSVIIDASGFMFAKRNATGDIYQINMTTGAASIISTAGAAGFNDGAVCRTMSVLPIRLLSFRANKNGNSTMLNWITASELNNKGFYMQHSIDGVNWNDLGFIPSKNSNSSFNENYLFEHLNPSQNLNYYRLKQVDLDGKSTLSNVLFVRFDKANNISTYPNPFTYQINIQGLTIGSTIQITNTIGQVIIAKTVKNKNETINTESLNRGLYLITVIDELTKEKTSSKIFKN